jgi:DNA-binding GntR family transcriptional regulator
VVGEQAGTASSTRGRARRRVNATNGERVTGLADQVYSRLRDDILCCEFMPGDAVSEASLAEQYGVGKAPVRASLARLRQEGLVEAVPRQGFVVRPLTVRDVRELYDARIILESNAARLAAGRIDAKALTGLNRAVRVGYTPGDRRTEARFLEANRKLHVRIAEASGNSRLVEIISALVAECDRILHLAMRLESSEARFRHGHEQIIEALQGGDGDTAAQEMARALANGRDLALSVLLIHSDSIDDEVIVGVRSALRALIR